MKVGVFFGLAALLSWGGADFFAGKLTRKIGNWWTFFLITFISFLFVAAYDVYLLGSRGFLFTGNFFYPAAAALFQTVGGASFCKGLENGKIGLVSAIASPWSIEVF